MGMVERAEEKNQQAITDSWNGFDIVKNIVNFAAVQKH